MGRLRERERSSSRAAVDGVKTDHVLSNARSLEAVCKCGSATVAHIDTHTHTHAEPLA